MNAIFYLLIPLVISVVLLYPLLRKAVSLLQILVKKYIQQTSCPSTSKETEKDIQTKTFNLKLLAYERIVLLIERLKPDSLVPRTIVPSLNSKEYQLLLLNEIRKEFEYNLSQQLYLSEEIWKMTVQFKDNVITLINQAARECPPASTSGELAQHILEQYIKSGIDADSIIRYARQDIQS